MERARETGLFRYSLVQELLEPGLSQAERGWRARELAGRVHEGPGGRRVTVSYSTLTRWRRRYEEGGFDALVPSPRQPAPRTPEEVLALAEALKREKPGRTAAQVRRILQVTAGWAPSDRTLQRLFERLELNRPAPGPEEEQRALGRFECTRPNEMWTGDTLHGPVIGGEKSYLFAFIDDHCAPRGALSYPRLSREELGGRFLGLMAYLDPKGEGDKSMPGNQRPCPGVWGGALRDPRDMAKAGLPESQSPEDASSASAGKTPETGAVPCAGMSKWPVQPPGRRSDAQ